MAMLEKAPDVERLERLIVELREEREATATRLAGLEVALEVLHATRNGARSRLPVVKAEALLAEVGLATRPAEGPRVLKAGAGRDGLGVRLGAKPRKRSAKTCVQCGKAFQGGPASRLCSKACAKKRHAALVKAKRQATAKGPAKPRATKRA